MNDAKAPRPGPWMTTVTGRKFWPLDPRPEDIDLQDIAGALSKLCRFGGHSPMFYSVAQHSVLVCYALKTAIRSSRMAQRWGLIHDAAEAYIGDMIRPIKTLLPAYQDAEDRLLACIVKRFRIDPSYMPPEVKEADDRMLVTERYAIFGGAGELWEPELRGVKPFKLFPEIWAPVLAQRMFLRTAEDLGMK